MKIEILFSLLFIFEFYGKKETRERGSRLTASCRTLSEAAAATHAKERRRERRAPGQVEAPSAEIECGKHT